MSKKEKRNTTLQDALSSMLRHLTIEKLGRFSTSINLGVSSLFRDIGVLINHKLSNHNFEERNIIINNIAENLHPIFGDYLGIKNLYVIGEFARKCTSEKIRYAAALMDWEYIPYFLNLEDENAWIFYMELIHAESLTPTELSKKISEKAFEEVKQFNIDEYISVFENTNIIYRNKVELYFSKKNSYIFRKLFEPQLDYHKNFNIISKETQVNHNIIINIYREILEFQSEYNHELNMKFNLMFWEIGVEIIRLSKLFNIPITSILDNHHVQEIYQNWPYLFKKDELYYSIKFVKQHGEDTLPPIELIQTVSWSYIKVLLEIEDVEKQKYVASQVLKNELSIQDLNEMIANNPLELCAEKLNKTKSVTTSMKKNFTVTGTIQEIEANIHPINDLNRNIFKNSELLEFLKEIGI
ncbi:DUF1016 N-terminal domain-containing protein [Pedobacter boryungensis]|uniref:YhcG N-terminal domain-containing protein n=1 Tax=Pedobacter boryungensis TaxID=869962 RepID=A0ABX2DCK5_9SPHI|nr:hypothetical protein [Pedobacter boryungensis]NQX31799.1 hypothetical protein [Pedobacter boryungensis]